MKIVRDNTYATIEFSGVTEEFIKQFEYNFGVYTGVRVPGYEKSKAYKLHEWDGYTLLYDKVNHRIPDGLFPQLQTYIETLQDRIPSLKYTVEDKRDEPFMTSEDIPDSLYFINEKGEKLTLLDYQDASVRKAIDTDKGILELATNAGKTGTSIALIEQLSNYLEKGETVAYFVPRIAIFDQAINSFISHFGKDNVGYWGAGKKHLSKINVISMGSMVSALKNPLDDKQNYPNNKKFVGKNRTLEIFVDTVIPLFDSHKNERLILSSLINTYPEGTKSQQEIKSWLRDAYDTKNTDSKVRMFLNSKNAEFVKLVENKMGDKYDKYLKAIDFTKSVKVIVVDEAHHSGADGYYRTLLSFPNAQYKYAMTGSIDRHDKLLLQRMRGIYGGVINAVTNDELIERGVSAKPTITMINVKGTLNLPKEDEKNFIKITELGIVKNDIRNTIITQIAKKMYNLDKPTLITVNRVEHGEILRDMLSEEDIPSVFLSGDDDSETRQAAIKGMTDGTVKVLIATSIFDEGVSVNNIRALIMAGSTKSLRLVLQRTGRSLRKKTTDNTALIFDFIDRNNPILRKHSEDRLRIYKNEGYDIKYLN